ncbi:MAG: DNA primase [bacterium]|nr:DNA primase [bacterium]
MPRIPEDIIREVNDASDIVDYVSGYVRLKKNGKDYSGLCPFHHEKSPSFHVSPDKQLFHCFGCGASGNLVQFVMRTENLDFIDAIKVMADRAGIVIPEEAGESDEQHSRRKRILEMNRLAARFYFLCLKDKKTGLEAQKYFTRRGINWKTVTAYGLGYAPQGRSALISYMKEKGYSYEQCLEAGLAIERENQGKKVIIDKFRDRVIFPIIDVRGNVIAFGGRVMHNNKEVNGFKIPKYLNSADTPVFDKGKNLFSLNLAKDVKSSNDDFLVLCEGYMDVISTYQAGIHNVVATLGTAITENQAKLMLRYAHEIVICYDMDEAGRKAALRAIDIINAQKGKSRVIKLRGAKDPDEYINKYGVDAFRDALKNAVPSTEFKLSLIKGKYDTSETEGKIKFVNEAAAALVGISDPVEVDAYIRRLSEENEISADAVYRALMAKTEGSKGKRAPIMRTYNKNKAEAGNEVSTALLAAERRLLSLIASKKALYKLAFEYIKPEELSTDIHRRLAEVIYQSYANGSYIDVPMILNEFANDPDKASIASAVFYNNEIYDSQEKAVEDLIRKIKLEKINLALSKEGDPVEFNRLVQEKKYWTGKKW